MPLPKVLLPAGFAFADLLIYWTGWDFMWKLDVMIIVGFILFFIGAAVKKTDALTKMAHAVWIAPWLIGLTILSSMGRYGAWGPKDVDGHNWLSRNHDFLPSSWDLLVIVLFSIAIYYWALACVMKQADVDAAIERDAHQINFMAE